MPKEKISRLVKQLKKFNKAYRLGTPLITDSEYDQLVLNLKTLDPNHAFLKNIEVEKFEKRKKIKHKKPMLSTEKAYEKKEVSRFVERVEKAASEIKYSGKITFKITSKLDGLAGNDDGKILATRGNGSVGYDVSHVFQLGIVPIGGRGNGLGELVMLKSYFDSEKMAEHFSHPRNMIVGIVSSDTVNIYAQKALEAGKVHFVPYSQLDFWTGSGEELVENYLSIMNKIFSNTDYPVDGIVAEVVEENIKKHLGNTSHHNKWQIAIKVKGEKSKANVTGVVWQVGRTGNVTPVVEIEPVQLSGATISRVSGHNAGYIKKMGIGVGSKIKIIRSGEVIPKIEESIKSGEVKIPENCPSCKSLLTWEKDIIKCNKNNCIEKIKGKILHWFKTIETADFFGEKAVIKIVKAGFNSLPRIYKMEEKDFVALGFGPVMSENFVKSLKNSLEKEIEDWRFLAALGVPRLGVGDSKKILLNFPLTKIFNLKSGEIEKIKGFGSISAEKIVTGLKFAKKTYNHFLKIKFPIKLTSKVNDSKVLNFFLGKNVVFTGKMEGGTRKQMSDFAINIGFSVQKAVSKSTDYLVYGEKISNAKLQKSKDNDVTVLSEIEYQQLVKNRT